LLHHRLPPAAAVSFAMITMPEAARAAQTGARIDTGNTAWVLVCTVLVLLMTVPGLALFYGGMVRKKNILATMMQSFFLCALISVIWAVIGYTLTFTNGNAWIGDLSRLGLRGIEDSWNQPFTLGAGSASPSPTTIPESVFLLYQMSFAVITPAVICGAVADRMKFSALILFLSFWSVLVYAPIAHWAWGATGWLNDMGLADFAGGTVVEVNSGISGLVCALVLGRRRGYGHDNMAPFNLAYAVIGASLLWVGWLGFNSGAALGANGRAGMAVLATQLAAGAATLSWSAAEWTLRGKPSVLGAVSGAVAGLVAITPAAGYVLPGPALLIGALAGLVCFWGATNLKHLLGYDDSLDVFGVHGLGGIVGTLATGLLAYGPLSAAPALEAGRYVGGLHQLSVQAIGVLATAIWAGAGSFVLLKLTELVLGGLRVTREAEIEGLDVVLHGEQLG
jgi:ammonium transporter, Amt family